ncbi:MAG: hypothetical protein ACM3MF_02945 [Anaerolineae bacterium]
MNKNISALLTLLCLGLAACAPVHPQPAVSAPQTLPLSQGQAVFIDIQDGILNVTSTSSGQLEVSGLPASTDDKAFSLSYMDDGVHLILKRQRSLFLQNQVPIQVGVSLPKGRVIHITNYDAALRFRSFDGEANITSLSGQVSVQDSTGNFTINADRADVMVGSTTGQVHIAGNYGLLSILDAHGTLSASTIMGTVRFAGPIAAGDIVSLETDHGPVEIQLAETSDVTVRVRTTSGVITCSMPGLDYAGQGCAGSLNGGQGQLKVRTVSGGVMLQRLP